MKGSQSTGSGQIATQPFADLAEVPVPWDPTPLPDVYREFLPTDARTVMIVMHPNHYNFIINPSMRADATGWWRKRAIVLDDAIWHVRSDSVHQTTGVDDGLNDLTGKGNTMLFGGGAAKPIVLPYAGTAYTYQPQNTTSTNYVELPAITYAPDDTIEWTADYSTLADTTYVINTTATANSAFFVYFNGTNLTYRLKWAAANQDHTWGSARLTGKHVYRLVRTTTTVELFVDDVSLGVKTFAQAVGTSNQIVRVGQTGTAASAERSKYYLLWIGSVAILNPAYIDTTTYATITNIGLAGGVWTVFRPTNGLKMVVVDRPVLLFGGAQYMDTLLPTQTTGTVLIAMREFADTSLNILGSGSGVDPPTTGGFKQEITGGTLSNVARIYDTGGGMNSSTGTMATHGNHVFAVSTDGVSMSHWMDGVRVISKTISAGVLLKDRVRIGSSAGYAAFAFVGAAVFDRLLTDEEVDQASDELIAETYVPPPTLTQSLNSDSWCGQSIVLDGAGEMRFEDTDSEDNPAYVYVGPSQQIDQLDWYEPGRSASEWTFSAYFKGGKSKVPPNGIDVMPARARLVMHAYYPSVDGVVKSPPQFQGLPVDDDPATMPYGPEASVVDNDGQVWTRIEGPFYSYLDKPPISATNPLSILSTGPQPPVGKAPFLMYNNRLYGLKDPYPENVGVALYEDLADPTEVADPAESLPTPGVTYLITTGSGDPNYNGQVWRLINQPYYQPTGQQAWFESVDGPWVELRDDGEWQRLYIQTDAFSREDDGRVSFLNCYWIDCIVQYENVDGTKISSLMLDPCESPVASYFDGAMTPEPNTDDFLWSKVDYTTQVPLENQCVSYYYYDMRSRFKWLWDNLRFLVPIGRPYQLFFGAYDRPYIPKGGTGASPEVGMTMAMQRDVVL